MKLTDVWTYVDQGNWGDIYQSGFALSYEDDNLRTGMIYLQVAEGENNIIIDMQGKNLDEAQFLELMSQFYQKATKNG